MLTTKRLTIETVNLDDERELNAFFNQVIDSGIKRVRAEGDELRRKGLLDEHGNVLLNELPPDMREESISAGRCPDAWSSSPALPARASRRIKDRCSYWTI
jgi:hypothetical protein